MKYRPGYAPRPSQTRYGQRVDNPPLENSDTARLRVLLQDETQDDWKLQRQINKELELKLRTVHDWRVEFQHRGGFADGRDIAMLWRAFSAVGAVALILLAALLAKAWH